MIVTLTAVLSVALAYGLAGFALMLRAHAHSSRSEAENRDLRERLETAERLSSRLQAEAERLRREALHAETGGVGFLERLETELRRPLNAVVGYSAVLARAGTRLEAGEQAAVAHVREAGLALAALAGRLKALDAACAPAGAGMRLNPALAARQACEQAAGAAAAGVRLIAPEPTPGLTVEADPERLNQLLSALIDNGLRHSPAGGVVTVAVLADADAARIRVRNTGDGVPPERMAVLFRPLAAGGGAGLAVARRLARSLGGRLEAQSAPGGGASFTLVLPRVDVDAGAASAPRTGRLPPAVVLHVETEPADGALMRSLLPQLGPVSVHGAASAAEAVSLARDLQPDLILTEDRLPDGDAPDLAARLAADPLTRRTPLLVLTADARPDRARLGREAGISAWMIKPLNVVTLTAAMRAALEARGQAQPRVTAA